MRAQWDGRTLRFRGGGSVPAPTWFTAGFPAQPLDGELWIGRDQFDALSGTVRKIEPVDAEWRQVRYLVFELPGAAGDFSERGACKLTLEVLDGNAPARALYRRLGFAAYQLDPAMGHAQFLQKWLA